MNECDSDPCENDGSCEDQVGGYVCTCANRFTGDKCDTGELTMNQYVQVHLGLDVQSLRVFLLAFCTSKMK